MTSVSLITSYEPRTTLHSLLCAATRFDRRDPLLVAEGAVCWFVDRDLHTRGRDDRERKNALLRLAIDDTGDPHHLCAVCSRHLRDLEGRSPSGDNVLSDEDPLSAMDLEAPTQTHFSTFSFSEHSTNSENPCQFIR